MSNKARCKQWRDTHQTEIKAYNEKYKINKSEMSRESSRKYREKNRKKLIMDNRQYRKDHKEQIKISAKKYREEHKDEIAAKREPKKKRQRENRHKENVPKNINEIIVHKRKICLKKNKIEIERIKAKWSK